MNEPQEATPGADDTSAFQRFYSGPVQAAPEQGLLYRLLFSWWRRRD